MGERVSTSADLVERLAGYAAAWRELDDVERAEVRARYLAEGWSLCDHPACPPWQCEQGWALPPVLCEHADDPHPAHRWRDEDGLSVRCPGVTR